MFQLPRCILLLSLMSAAAPDSALAKRTPEGNNTVPILGFMAGYNSCPSRWFGDIHATTMGYAADLLAEHLKRATAAADIEYVVSCFPRSTDRIRFVTSSDRGLHHYHGYVDHIVDEITALARKHPDHQVYLAGHSYGGWLAMYTASLLPSWVNVAIVATIDPISAVNCEPSTFVRSVLRSSVYMTPVAGCTEAPTDLSHHRIQSRTKLWLNYFQANYPLLHSGAIKAANRNERLDFHNDEYTEAHILIEEDDRVWAEFNLQVVRNLRKNLAASD